ncbi:MAG: acetate kinase [Oscillospiraceae bacterium]|nr:acetate kinase [Oscillospiraceae bacterium]
MYVLVINAGSSSVKYQLFDMDKKDVLAKGNCERIGIDGRVIHKVPGKPDFISDTPLPDHSHAIKSIVDVLTNKEHGVINSMNEINAIGHRIVHGGPYFTESTLVTPDVIKILDEKCRDLAPLHTGPHLMGIGGCLEYMPNTPQVLVFDTAFHKTMPKHAYLYPVPREYYDKYKIRKYGFHGTSHKYVSERANGALEKLGKNPDETRIVTCHLGNGSSIAAVKGGKSIDTSMGFTPLDGLIMGSRTGALDPAIVTYIIDNEGFTPKQMYEFMNKNCGLLAVSGISSDMREIEDAIAAGNENAKLAFDVLCYDIKKFIGSYAAAMGGLDAVVFTAGIGENNPDLRESVIDGLQFLNISINKEKNKNAKKYKDPVVDISSENSIGKVYVIPTDEELVIASDTENIVKGLK